MADCMRRSSIRFQSTPPARGATYRLYDGSGYQYISIHAPREGGDISPDTIWRIAYISIHAPREGGDYVFAPGSPLLYDFNPRPPRGGRRYMITSSLPYCIISIHAPREGGDLDFLGTVLDFIISIHAPREGGDLLYGKIRHLNQDFNPRPPRGGRPQWHRCDAVQQGISIHAPREGGDSNFTPHVGDIIISIHAPLEGGDLIGCMTVPVISIFQSTPPARGATWFLFMVM